MMWPFPQLEPARTPSPTPCPLKPVRPGLATEMQARDAARLSGASAKGPGGVTWPLLNRVVYDSVSPPEAPRTETGRDESIQAALAAAERSTGGVGTAGPANPTPAFGVTGVVGALEHWYHPTGPTDDTLMFESRFESGNLRRAIQVCVLQPCARQL